MIFDFKPIEQIPDLVLIEPRVFGDERGFFDNLYVFSDFKEFGINAEFKQISKSYSSKRGTLRGLHFQNPPHAQGKLIHVISGKIFDVAVDIRKDSPTFGKWESVELSDENGALFWIPPGFAHGFCTLAEDVKIVYFLTNEYDPESERSVRWNDPDLDILWPVDDPILSEKDANASFFKDIEG